MLLQGGGERQVGQPLVVVIKSRYLGDSGRSRADRLLLLPAGGGALRDAAVGGGADDQVHAVEFVAQVAPAAVSATG